MNLISVRDLASQGHPLGDLVVLHFEDGPAHGQGNVQALDGSRHVLLLKAQVGWPTPDYVVTLIAQGTFMVRPYDIHKEKVSELPRVACVYVKVAESRIPEGYEILRGSTYRVGTPGGND